MIVCIQFKGAGTPFGQVYRIHGNRCPLRAKRQNQAGSHTSATDELLQFCLDNDLGNILLSWNEHGGYRVTGTGTHSGVTVTPPPKKTAPESTAVPAAATLSVLPSV